MNTALQPQGSDDYFKRTKEGPTFTLPTDAAGPLYPEEFIRFDDRIKKRCANIPPAFEDHSVNLSEIVGHPLPDPYNDAFLMYIRDMIDAARHYNRALYRYRRARYILDSAQLYHLEMPPLRDDESNEYKFPPSSPSDTQKTCNLIDAEFARRSNSLKEWLNGYSVDVSGNHNMPVSDRPGTYYEFSGHVDVVAVNDYIISVRIAANVEFTASKQVLIQKAFTQPGYQSSSHISISSKYSSP